MLPIGDYMAETTHAGKILSLLLERLNLKVMERECPSKHEGHCKDDHTWADGDPCPNCEGLGVIFKLEVRQ